VHIPHGRYVGATIYQRGRAPINAVADYGRSAVFVDDPGGDVRLTDATHRYTNKPATGKIVSAYSKSSKAEMAGTRTTS